MKGTASAGLELQPAGNYKAKIINEREDQVPTKETDDDGKVITATYVELDWQVQEGDLKGKIISDKMPLKCSPKSKLGERYNTLTGAIPEKGSDFDTKDLHNIDATITVTVENVPGKEPGTTFDVNRVKAVIKEKKK